LVHIAIKKQKVTVIKVYNDPEILLAALADLIVAKSDEAILKTGRFNFVLSGGSSPKKLFELLASVQYRNKIKWEKVFFFFGDERYVPLDDQQSNYLMAKKALFDPLKINIENIFPMQTSLSPEQCATDYEQKIRAHFNGPCIFDFILLGLGDNSHTASLFPYTSVLHEKHALIKDIFVEEVKMFRITFTAPLINAARLIIFLVYGAGKAEALKHIIEDPKDIELYPAQLINPDKGELHWFVDQPAARLLTSIPG
jgi:6-phosphogluconolactonase